MVIKAKRTRHITYRLKDTEKKEVCTINEDKCTYKI
jgi:hypothetical protein